MKITVVTAVYNRRETVGAAIKSVQSQHSVDLEHIVQDGGSTDGTLDVIEAMTDNRTNLQSGPDQGLYDAINRGIKRASGEVIGLMHSDDMFASDNVLARVRAAFEKEQADGAYGDLDYVSALSPDRIIRRWRSGEYHPDKLRRGWMPPHPTLYLRREVFEQFGLYDTEFKIAADYEAMLRWLIQGGIRLTYVPHVMVRMRVGGESNRSIGRILRKSREDYTAIRRHEIGGVGTLLAKNFSKLGQFVGE